MRLSSHRRLGKAASASNGGLVSGSRASLASRHSRRSINHANSNGHANGGLSYRHEAPMLNDKYFPR